MFNVTVSIIFESKNNLLGKYVSNTTLRKGVSEKRVVHRYSKKIAGVVDHLVGNLCLERKVPDFVEYNLLAVHPLEFFKCTFSNFYVLNRV